MHNTLSTMHGWSSMHCLLLFDSWPPDTSPTTPPTWRCLSCFSLWALLGKLIQIRDCLPWHTYADHTHTLIMVWLWCYRSLNCRYGSLESLPITRGVLVLHLAPLFYADALRMRQRHPQPSASSLWSNARCAICAVWGPHHLCAVSAFSYCVLQHLQAMRVGNRKAEVYLLPPAV